MKSIAYVVGIAVSWVLIYQLNMKLFSSLAQTPYITWIFLPAGLKLAVILIFGEIAIIGLLIGTLITSVTIKAGLIKSVVLSFISAINPYIAVNLTRHFLKVDAILTNLSASHLLILSFISAFFNGVCHNIYLFTSETSNQPFADTFAMFIGDFIGCLIFLYSFGLVIKLIIKSLGN